MKLLTKTNLNFLSISLFVFLIGLVAFYYLMRKQVDQNINLELEKRKTSILNQLESIHSTGKTPESKQEKVIIKPVDSGNNVTETYSDTLLYIESEEKYVPYRQLLFTTSINNQEFTVQVFKSLEETDMLIVRIFLIMTSVVVVIILTLLLMNHFISLRAWKVFYDTVDKVKKYKVVNHDQFSLLPAEVKEFDELNKVLISMTDRMKKDYYNLKEYTENASHEIQTPLAIISAKLELLLQSGSLKEEEFKAVDEAYRASNRLSRLNKTLILLAKIENRQFPESSLVKPTDIIKNQLDTLDDLIQAKQLKIKAELENDLSVEMNPYLAEILMLNLVKNAIRHNMKKGEIHIQLPNNKFIISNTGKELQGDAEKLFQRFNKSNDASDSTGLGLAIVKKICELYGFQVNYEYADKMHRITLNFVPKNNQ